MSMAVKSRADGKSDPERQVVHNHKRFLEFNARKLAQIKDQLPTRKELALDLAPVLFHANPNDRRGPFAKITHDTPAGIRYLEKPRDLNKLLNKLDEPPALPRLKWGLQAYAAPIRSLLLMGSLGSIGHTTKSDFDFWVVIDREELGPEGERKLKRKCDLISAWFKRYARAEASFFLVDLKDVVENRFGELEGESAGSALGTLLKEEFYRSMTLLGGQTPWWWVLPGGLDKEAYQGRIARLQKTIRFDPRQFVDLGPLHRLDPAEYFGASLWEIQKGLDRPFKSALKMALLEAYSESATTGLLAEELRTKVMTEEGSTPDSYLLLFDRVQEHLRSRKRTDDLETIRQCLFLKSRPGLTGADLARVRSLKGRRAVFAEYVNSWGWTKERVDSLTGFTSWSMSRKLALANRINKYMLSTYARLARRVREGSVGGPKINTRDLTMVGRRLMAYFGRKKHQLGLLPNLLEDAEPLGTISLIPLGLAKGSRTMVWEGYEGGLTRDRVDRSLKRTLGLPALITWLMINGLADGRTTFYMDNPPGQLRLPVAMPEVQSLFSFLQEVLGMVRENPPSRLDLSEPVRIMKIILIPNLEHEESGEKLTGLAIIRLTSWGEVYAQESGSGPDPLQELRELLAEADPLFLPEIHLHLADRPESPALAARLRKALTGYHLLSGA